MVKRPGTMTDDERAEIGRAHRAAPLVVVDEITGRYDGEELEEMRRQRAERDPAAAILSLERKHAALDKTVAVGFAKTNSKLDTLVDLAAKSDAERVRRAAADAEERERKAQADQKALDGKRRYLIALVGALGMAIAGIVAAVVR